MARGGVVATVARAAGWAALALVAIVLGTVAALPAAGRRVMVVTGGSMGTTIPVGSAAVVAEVDGDDLGPGDVVTFARAGGTGLTTHRVVSTHVVGGEPHLRTQGDANDTPDPDLVPLGALVGRVEASAPRVGSWLLVASRPDVRLALVALPALAVARRQVRVLARAAGFAAVLAVLVATASAPPAATGATYADTALAGGAAFSTGTFPP